MNIDKMKIKNKFKISGEKLMIKDDVVDYNCYSNNSTHSFFKILNYNEFKLIKKLPKISLSPQQATKYSPRNFSLSATNNFSLSKSATASCGVLNPDLEIRIIKKNHDKLNYKKIEIINI